MTDLRVVVVITVVCAAPLVTLGVARALVHLRRRLRRGAPTPEDDTEVSADAAVVTDLEPATARLRRRARRDVALTFVAAFAVEFVVVFAFSSAVWGAWPFLSFLVAAFVAVVLAAVFRRRLRRTTVEGPRWIRSRFRFFSALENFQYALLGLVGAMMGFGVGTIAGALIVAFAVSNTDPGIPLSTLAIDTSVLLITDPVAVAAVVGFLACMATGRWGMRVFRTATLPSADDVLSRDQRAAVLILRSFAHDRAKIETASPWDRPLMDVLWPSMSDGFERVLGRTLQAHGPPIAISPPELAVGHGSFRDRVPAEDWLRHVFYRAAEAKFIVVLLGDTPGLLEELELLTESQELMRRTVFLVPPDEPNADAISEEVAALLRLDAERGRTFARHPVGFTRTSDGFVWFVDQCHDEYSLIALFERLGAAFEPPSARTARESRSGISFELRLPSFFSIANLGSWMQPSRLFVDGTWMAEFEINHEVTVRVPPGTHEITLKTGENLNLRRPLRARRARERTRRSRSGRPAWFDQPITVAVSEGSITEVVVIVSWRGVSVEVEKEPIEIEGLTWGLFDRRVRRQR